ncbi:MAG: recombination protein NinG [Odoribacter sp.]
MNYKEKLDRIFSQYIRLRDVNSDGYGMCISCGKIIHWKEGDAGHYINRAEMSTRYCEKNVHLQCRFDNRFREGNMLGYTKGLIKKYGIGILDELEILKSSTSHLSKFEYDVLIKHYQSEVKRLLKEKNL